MNIRQVLDIVEQFSVPTRLMAELDNGNSLWINVRDLNFPAKKNAAEYLETLDLEYMDNERFAFLDVPEEIALYLRKVDTGCCGYYDELITVDGREALIGCNYGH